MEIRCFGVKIMGRSIGRSIAPMPPQQQKQGIQKPEKGLAKIMTNEVAMALNGLNKITIGGDAMDATFSYHDEELLNPTYNDENSEQPAEHLIASAVVNCIENNPDVSPTISDECRIDYTDEVKRKYFNVQEKNENNHSNRFHLPRKEGRHEVDEGIPLQIFANDPTFVPALIQSSMSSAGVGVSTRRSNDNEKINKTQKGGYRTQTKSGGPNTPPLTLYSNKGIPPLTLQKSTSDDDHHDNPNTDESAGPLSPSLSMDMYSNEQKAQNSPAARLTPLLNSIPPYTPEPGSVGSASTANHHYLIKQPVLYSAIGSLEHANSNSLTNLNKRFLAPSKEFCKPGKRAAATTTGQSILLIPPARQYQKGQHEQPTSQKSSSSQTKTSRLDLRTFQQKDRDDTSLTNKKLYASVKEENHSGNKSTGDTNDSIPTSVSHDKLSTRDQINGRQTPMSDSKTTTNANTENTKISSDSKNNNNRRRSKSNKKVSYDPNAKKKRAKPKTVEMFRPSSDAYTPRIERKKIKYKAAEARPSVQHMSSPMGTIQRPNFRDALRRVAMIIQQHIVKIESRFEQQGGQFNESARRTKGGVTNDGLFHASMRDMFNEDSYRTPTYKCNMARIPMARPGMVYGLRKIKVAYTIPSETEIYDFGHQLFKSVQLSSECSIVCLIYVERLMEAANVPLLACTWRPIFMCGLLLASKVWQDLSSWNIEFSSVYPQFSLESINKLELNFLRSVKWDLYISSR